MAVLKQNRMLYILFLVLEFWAANQLGLMKSGGVESPPIIWGKVLPPPSLVEIPRWDRVGPLVLIVYETPPSSFF